MSERNVIYYGPDELRLKISEAKRNSRCDESFIWFSQVAASVELVGTFISGAAWMYRPDTFSLTIPGSMFFLIMGNAVASIYYAIQQDSQKQKLRKLRRSARALGIYD